VQRLRQFVDRWWNPAETSLHIDSYLSTMDTERRSTACTDISMDRRIIRVDIPPAHAGITAALRRAFSPVNDDSYEQNFEDLLRRLN
jgi:hypothetical protein